MKNLIPVQRKIVAACLLYCFLTACNTEMPGLAPQQAVDVKDSVTKMTEDIAINISQKGPLAWLTYFENTPQFFMASEGQVAFVNYDSAVSFIQTKLVKMISSIQLKWSNMRVDPLTPSLASIAANFHEDLTGFTGITTPADGYFTAIAEKGSHGWQLRNLHWSLIAK